MTFCVIKKKHKINYFALKIKLLFKKSTKNNFKCSRKHKITAAKCFSAIIIVFCARAATIFDEKNNNIKAETNKTPTD